MHMKIKKFSCLQCNKKFNDRSNKNRHMRETHPQFPPHPRVLFHCHICRFVTFSRHDNLNLHLRRIHGIQNSLQIKSRLFYCDLCENVAFVTKPSLLNHMRKEHIKVLQRKENFRCIECSKPFMSKDTLTSHLSGVHMKKFLCRYCNKILGSQRTLKIHEKRRNCQ